MFGTGIYTQFGLFSKYSYNKNFAIPNFIILNNNRANLTVCGPSSFFLMLLLFLNLWNCSQFVFSLILAGNQLTEERDSALGQVEFLNSVIVDLQKKNSDLKTRLEVMESGVVTNGDGDSSMESE